MLSYPFIQGVFQSILDKSLLIDGRLHVCPKWGGEVNNINIDEVIPNALPNRPKYPCALLMPPSSTGVYQYDDNQSNQGVYEINLVFITGATHTQQNAIAKPNEALQSAHTIPETWHDMRRCAVSFLRVLQELIVAQNLSNDIYVSDRTLPEIHPITTIGNDQVSGVLLRFKLGVSTGCGVEDYPDDYTTAITLPTATDVHPLHLDV